MVLLEDAVVLSRHFGNHGYHAAGGGGSFTLQWTPGDSRTIVYWDEHRGVRSILFPVARPNSLKATTWALLVAAPSATTCSGPPRSVARSYGDHLVVEWAIEKLMKRRSRSSRGRSLPPSHSMGGRSKMVRPLSMDEVKLPLHQADDLKDARPRTPELAQVGDDNKQWKHLMQGYLANARRPRLGRLLDALDGLACGKTPLWFCGATTDSTSKEGGKVRSAGSDYPGPLVHSCPRHKQRR